MTDQAETASPEAPAPRRSFWRRRRTMVTVALVLVVALPFAYDRWWPRDSARSVDAETALDRFRDGSAPSTVNTEAPTDSSPVTESTLSPVAAPDTPAEGIYRYVTSGRESIDALGGTTHEYPAETLLTVVDRGCGALLRWDVLVERFDEWSLCATPDGIELQATGMAFFHQFFGIANRDPAECDRAVLLVPADGLPREPEAMTCECADRPWPAVWTVVGVESLTVEGSPVVVTHVRMTLDWVDGKLFEHTVNDWWLDASGLPVRMVSKKESTNDSGVIGAVLYKEEYTADLVSLTPLT